jgi:hypothetical protein
LHGGAAQQEECCTEHGEHASGAEEDGAVAGDVEEEVAREEDAEQTAGDGPEVDTANAAARGPAGAQREAPDEGADGAEKGEGQEKDEGGVQEDADGPGQGDERGQRAREGVQGKDEHDAARGEQELHGERAGARGAVGQATPDGVADGDAGEGDTDGAGPGVERLAEIGRRKTGGDKLQQHDGGAGGEHGGERYRQERARGVVFAGGRYFE